MRRVHVIIKGNVQGVFFRAHISEHAKVLGINGWVKNTEEGVEAVFEGENEKIKDMLEFCALGPKGARVKKIDVAEQSYAGEFDDFIIEY